MLKMKINKNIKSVLLILSLCIISMCGLFGCGKGNSSYLKKIEKSRESVNETVVKASVNDGNILVYEYEQVLTYRENTTWESVIKESMMDFSFNLKTSTENAEVELDRKNLLAFNLDEQTFKSAKKENGTLTFTKEGSSLSEIFNSKELEVKDTAEFTVTFENDLLSDMNCKFALNSGKTVVISIHCAY